jgi:uncharacterized protein
MAPKRRRDVAAAENDQQDPPTSPSEVRASKRMRMRKGSGRKASETADTKPAASRRSTKDQPCDMNIDSHLVPSVVCMDEDLTFVLRAAESFVKQELSGNDSSHDFFHISRVRAVAETLSVKEGLSVPARQVVSLAALLHDVGDWKYAKDKGKSQGKAVETFLKSQGVSRRVVQVVTGIISRVGFKEELVQGSNVPMSLEAKIVQDADRLDAIGAIGVARCLTFGGAKNRVLHDPAIPPRLNMSKEQYMEGAEKATTINHFDEKLLKLKDMMKTEAGREMAAKRHLFMESFLHEFNEEWEGRA